MAMLGYELGRKKFRRTLYGGGYIGKVPMLICPVLVSYPFLWLIYSIHNIKTPKPTIISMYNKVDVGPGQKVKLWILWKTDEHVALSVEQCRRPCTSLAVFHIFFMNLPHFLARQGMVVRSNPQRKSFSLWSWDLDPFAILWMIIIISGFIISEQTTFPELLFF